jgi:hypothetical protein
MDAEHQQVRPSHPRITSSFWRKLGLAILVLGVVLIAVGRSMYAMYDGGLYVRPSIHHQLSCADSRQCVVTIQHAGGGFDHGFNPAYSWVITGDPVASLHFSPTAGTLQAHQSVQVQVVIAPGTCPNSITITSKNETAHFSPFLFDPRTGQCSVVAPVISA